MTLRSLEVFLAVVEGGSMRAAAERLYISQPSVSGVVADLEDEYGVRLFERLGKKLCITQEGEQLAGYARRMLSLNEEIGRQMHCAGIRTPLRLGASVTVASGIMAELAGRVQGPSPYVYVANTGIIEQKILRNELDVGIVEGHIKSEDLLVTPMMPDRLVLVCRPDHWCSGRDSIRLRELEAERLILREPESGTRQVLDLEFPRAGVSMQVGWECTTSQAILDAVAAGLGVALMSPRLLCKGMNLAAIPISDGPVERWFSLVIHKDKYIGPPLRAFLELCKEYKENK